MKNQYFGDINDYRKYGLLRVLVPSAGLSTIVAWMLTSDDGKTDGRKIAYLDQPERWKAFDRKLFDFLRSTVIDRSLRSISEIESSGLLLGCRFHSKSIDSTIEHREVYFQKLWKMAGSPGLVFFDPDNGFEVPAVRRGWRMAPKYLYWSEFCEGFRQGHSLLIFQHFRLRSASRRNGLIIGKKVRQHGKGSVCYCPLGLTRCIFSCSSAVP